VRSSGGRILVNVEVTAKKLKPNQKFCTYNIENSLRANPLARSQGQVKLDSKK